MSEEHRRITASEREAILRLNLALSILIDYTKDLERRTKDVKRGSFYLASAQKMLEMYLEACYKTIPTEQLKILQRSIREMTYTVGIRCTARNVRNDKEWGVVVPLDVINTLFSACKDHCLTCLAYGEDQARCELKKALDTVPNDSMDQPDGSCPYKAIF